MLADVGAGVVLTLTQLLQQLRGWCSTLGSPESWLPAVLTWLFQEILWSTSATPGILCRGATHWPASSVPSCSSKAWLPPVKVGTCLTPLCALFWVDLVAGPWLFLWKKPANGVSSDVSKITLENKTYHKEVMFPQYSPWRCPSWWPTPDNSKTSSQDPRSEVTAWALTLCYIPTHSWICLMVYISR